MESESSEHHGQMGLFPFHNVLSTREKLFHTGSQLTGLEHTFSTSTMECKDQQACMGHSLDVADGEKEPFHYDGEFDLLLSDW